MILHDCLLNLSISNSIINKVLLKSTVHELFYSVLTHIGENKNRWGILIFKPSPSLNLKKKKEKIIYEPIKKEKMKSRIDNEL